MFDFFRKRVPGNSVTASEAKSRLDQGAVGIDVRETSEWNSGHIAGSRHVPLGDLDRAFASIPHDRDLIIICASGMRSSRACNVLQRRGFTAVFNVSGGISAWKRAGLPLIS